MQKCCDNAGADLDCHLWLVTHYTAACLKGAKALTQSISNFPSTVVQRLGYNAHVTEVHEQKCKGSRWSSII